MRRAVYLEQTFNWLAAKYSTKDTLYITTSLAYKLIIMSRQPINAVGDLIQISKLYVYLNHLHWHLL